MWVRTVCGDRNSRSATALRPSPATMQRSTSRSRGVRDSTSRSLSVRCLRAAVSSRSTPVSSAGGRCVSSRSTPRMTVSSRDSEQSLATQPDAPAWRASAARRGSSFSASTTVRTARLGRADAGDQRDAVDEPVLAGARAGTGTAGRTPRHGSAAQVGVDEQDVEAAALGGRALQTAQRGRAAAGRGDVDVRLGRQGGGERLGEDAVVVDDQNPDTNHETPPGSSEHGIPRRGVRRPEQCGYDARDRGAAAARPPPC